MSWMKMKGLTKDFINRYSTLSPFVPNAPIPCPDFLMFSGVRERLHWEQMG